MRIPTLNTSIPVKVFILIELPLRMLIRTPNCPPIKTAISKGSVIEKEKSNVLFNTNPKSPEREFTSIKKAVNAAILMGFPQRKWSSKGAKNTPPPMPTRPDKNPIAPPMI